MIKIWVLLPLFLTVGCTENFKRAFKTTKSNWLGGLNRSCVVYSDSGSKIREYKGRFDLIFGNDRITFDKDGKRTVIVSAPVVCDEL